MRRTGFGTGTWAAGLLALTTAPAAAQMAPPPPAAAAAAATITAGDMRTKLGVLAHDSMRGRDTPSPELMETARYVADRFAAAGLAPGNGDAWLQLYPISRVAPGSAAAHRLEIRGPSGTTEPAWGEEYFNLHEARTAAGEGELILVDPASESMPDVNGRVVVAHVTPANLRQVLGGTLGAKLEAYEPAGVLVVLDIPDNFFAQMRGYLSGDRARVGEVEAEGTPAAFVAMSALPPDLAAAISAGTLPGGWSALMRSEATVEVEEAPNTIGWLEGSDPVLKDEYVVFSAHMDHDGVKAPVEGDSIWNGADDNASGTVTVMELAEAFASLPERPRRSIVFLAVSGEEKGLLGSGWYAEHPTFPLERTVADINIDMVGRNWQDTIVAIGKEESSLGPLADRIAAEHPELDMAVIDDIWPEESFYTRSDHFNFARRGVPILFFFNGTHDDYHRPSDEADKIEYDKMARIGRMLFYLGLEVANADERPQWDPAAYARVVAPASD